MNERWDYLVSRFLDGAAAPEEVRELDGILKRDPEARRRFVLAADQDASIGILVSTLEQRDAMVRRVASKRRRLSPGRSDPAAPWIWAAAAAILMGVLLYAGRPAPTTRAPQVPVVKNEPIPIPEMPRPIPTPTPIPPEPRREVVLEIPSRVDVPAPAPDPAPAAPVPAPEKPPPREERKTLPDAAPIVPSVVVAQVDGDLDAKAPFAWKEGATLSARGKPASVVFEGGTRLTMAPGAELKLALAQPLTVGLEKGEVYCSVAPSKTPALTVITATAEARVLGTQFSVALEGDGTRISVDEGSVRVSRRGDPRGYSLRGGQSVSVAPGQPLAVKVRAPNLLSDPGFEFGGRGWKGFEGRAPSFGPELRAIAAPVHRGKAALQAAEDFQSNFCQGVAVEAGAVYDVEAWVKIPGAGSWGMTVVWLDETGNWKAWAGASNLPKVDGPADWTRVSGRFTAPPRAKTGWITVYPVKSGAAIFDDFSFSLISR